MFCAMCPRASHSLRQRVLAWALLPLAALTLARVALAYHQAQQTAEIVYDDALLASAHSIAEQIRFTDGEWEALIPPSALERLGRPQHDRVAYRVEAPSGEILAGYPDTPRTSVDMRGGDPIFFAATFRSQPMRLVSILQPVAGAKDPARVTVGETLQSREALADSLWRHVAVEDVLALLFAGAAIMAGVSRGLAPLGRLTQAVRARMPGSLEPLDASDAPRELEPLVGALNAAVAQANAQIVQRERFVADAAHQLRTPLALLNTQAAVGIESRSLFEKDAALAGMAAAASGMARVTQQLLILAQAEAWSPDAAHEPVDLLQVARKVLAELAPRALDSSVDLALSATGDAVLVDGPAVLLEELLRNLVDNALVHAPGGREIEVGLANQDGRARLTVRDHGSGLPPDQRDRVFDRFHRAPGTAGDGSGLGLAIVAEIVRRQGGRVRIGDPADGQGLEVVVDLPLAAVVEGR
jgi:two-component system sensor histidine kinase TctE